MKTRPLISFDLICQDEELFIGQCLRYMKKLASCINGEVEFVIVDGGSKDRTLEIVEQEKDERFKIFQNPWPGFAAQRNFAFSKLTGEWIMSHACDALVSDELFIKINDLLSSKEAMSYSFPKIHLEKDINHMYDRFDRDPILLIHRNLKEFHWGGVGLENLHYKERVLPQHPAHFEYGWQRYVADVTVIHFEGLKSTQEKIDKAIKRSNLQGSFWLGQKPENIAEQVRNLYIPICPITKHYPSGIKFYAEIMEAVDGKK